jgi:hypothetical protein
VRLNGTFSAHVAYRTQVPQCELVKTDIWQSDKTLGHAEQDPFERRLCHDPNDITEGPPADYFESKLAEFLSSDLNGLDNILVQAMQ